MGTSSKRDGCQKNPGRRPGVLPSIVETRDMIDNYSERPLTDLFQIIVISYCKIIEKIISRILDTSFGYSNLLIKLIYTHNTEQTKGRLGQMLLPDNAGYCLKGDVKICRSLPLLAASGCCDVAAFCRRLR